MSHLWRTLVQAAATLLLCSCTSRPLFLFFQDTYSDQLQPGLAGGKYPLAGGLEPMFRTAAAIRPPGPEAEKELRALLSSRRPSVVYLSPLFGLDAGRLAAEFPETTFVSAEAAGREGTAAIPGRIGLRFEHDSAMRAAGRLAARVAGDSALLAQARTGSAAVVATGILVAESAPWLQRWVAAFREGFAEAGTGAQPLFRQVDSSNDRVRARQLLEEMRQQGAGIFLLLTYSLTGFCLEYLAKEGAVAIVQDGTAASAYPEVVLAYLEEDTAEALRQLRDLIGRQPPAGPGGTPGLLSIPARLRGGPALQGLAAGLLEGAQTQ